MSQAPVQTLFDLECPIRSGCRERSGNDPLLAECAARLVEFLLGARGSHRTYVHALFEEILPRPHACQEGADILTHHLLGFDADDAHAFEQKPHSTLGAIWQELLRIVYTEAFPGKIRTDWHTLADKLPKEERPRKGDKFAAEFFFDSWANEQKYRCNSIDYLRRQKKAARYLTRMGLVPRMLILRPSPNAEEYRRAGWFVFEAEDAFDLVREETGVDIEAVVAIASLDPRIRSLRAAGRTRMFQRVGAICTGHYARNPERVAPIVHTAISRNPAALEDILRRARDAGTLADAVAAICDHAWDRAGRGRQEMRQHLERLMARRPTEADSD